jgi:hypothetical protein
MRPIPDQLKSRNLVPFKKRNGRYNIPDLASEHEAMMDADLSPEEQGFIRYYLGYADAFLRSVEHIVPEPREEPVAKNEREEATEQPSQAKGNPTSKAA